MQLAEVVSSHHERAVVRAGAVFIKVETQPEEAEREIAALQTMTAVPVPTLLWFDVGPPYVIALAQLPGRPLATEDGDSRSAPVHGSRPERCWRRFTSLSSRRPRTSNELRRPCVPM